MSRHVYITHTTAFLPNDPINNDEMEHILGQVGTNPSRARKLILKSNGIHTRHYAIDPVTGAATHNCAELAAQAIQQLFQQGVNPDEVGVLACGTSNPDQIMPGHGVMVHGLLPKTPAYEVVSMAGICVAGMAAMKYAHYAILAGAHHQAIACAAENASAMMRARGFQGEIKSLATQSIRPEIAFEKDFLRWMLSDGAGAVHLSDTPSTNQISLKIHWIELVSYANEMPACMYAGGEYVGHTFTGWKEFSQHTLLSKSILSVKQDVKLLNDNIIAYALEKALAGCLKKYPMKADDIDYFLPHYSSQFFRDKVAVGLSNMGFEIPLHKWFTNLPTKGNTGSASIYIMLDEFMHTHSLSAGQKILCFIPESGRFSSSFMLLEVVNGD